MLYRVRPIKLRRIQQTLHGSVTWLMERAHDTVKEGELLCLEYTLKREIKQARTELVQFPFQDAEVGLYRCRIRKHCSDTDAEASQLVETTALLPCHSVPCVIEQSPGIMVVNDGQDAGLVPVRLPKSAMVRLDTIDLMICP